MKLRIAKKVFKNPDDYTGQQRYTAAHRLFTRASTFRDGEAGLAALLLKPQRSFRLDDQLDLRLESFLADVEAGVEILFPRGEVVVPQTNIKKPARRKDGQVMNFNAAPFPHKFHYTPVELTGDVIERDAKDGVVEGRLAVKGGELVVDELYEKKWEWGEWRIPRKYTAKKYQVRTGGLDRGQRPKRLKFRDFDTNGQRTPESYRRPRDRRDAQVRSGL